MYLMLIYKQLKNSLLSHIQSMLIMLPFKILLFPLTVPRKSFRLFLRKHFYKALTFDADYKIHQ